MKEVAALIARPAGPLRSRDSPGEVRTGHVLIEAGQGPSDHAIERGADPIMIGPTKHRRVGKMQLGSDVEVALMIVPSPVSASRN